MIFLKFHYILCYLYGFKGTGYSDNALIWKSLNIRTFSCIRGETGQSFCVQSDPARFTFLSGLVRADRF